MTSKKSYAYSFTINNYTEADQLELKKLEENPKTRYLCFGKEVGQEGTPHIQGYVYFQNQMVFASFKKLLTRAHIEPSRGTVDDNVAYCSKDGDFYEHGDRPINQKRKGQLGAEYWETNKKLAMEGKLDQVDPKLFLTHYRTLKVISFDHAPKQANLEQLDNYWYYGPTGVGKSRKAHEDHPGAFLKGANKWWCDYKYEDVVLIEELDKTHACLGHHLKIWADHYVFPAEVKGGKINIRPKSIIVTSNWHPSEIWSEPQTLEPILRRFKLVHFQGSINNLL